MGKKVNVMAEVSQEVYDTVVVPHKRSKTFTSVIETLITGYYSNVYIRSFVDDSLEGAQQQSNDVLNDIINNMHQGLANMGVYTEEMKSNSQDGIDAFGKKAEETKKEMEDINAQEIKSVKESVEELKNQNEEIMSMLKNFMAAGISMVQQYSEPTKVQETANVDVSEESSADLDEIGSLWDSTNEEYVAPVEEKVEASVKEEAQGTADESKPTEQKEEPASETSEEEANNILASLLVGQEYSF